ncbi:MAG: hypothetical protein O3C32_04780 [Bacteroidetes bacterium]|jgi:hypothetical protein|nr:hypothetical protein [Bacteroidota bacterium]
MKSYLKFLGPGLTYIIGGLGLLGFILVMSTGLSKEDVELMTLNADGEAAGAVSRFNGSVGFFMGLTLAAVGLAAGLIFAFVGRTAIQDSKKLKKPLMFTAGIAAIFAFSFLFASGRESYDLANKSMETVEFINSVADGAFYFADAALLTMMIMLGLSVAAIVYTEVSKMLK